MRSLIWFLVSDLDDDVTVKSLALVVLKTSMGKASSCVLERLKPGFFLKILGLLKEGISQQGLNAALQIVLDTCSWGSSRIMLIENDAIFELIQLNLENSEKKTTELSLGILFHLCSSAEERAKFLGHADAIDILTNKLLNVFPAADDYIMLILSLL